MAWTGFGGNSRSGSASSNASLASSLRGDTGYSVSVYSDNESGSNDIDTSGLTAGYGKGTGTGGQGGGGGGGGSGPINGTGALIEKNGQLGRMVTTTTTTGGRNEHTRTVTRFVPDAAANAARTQQQQAAAQQAAAQQAQQAAAAQQAQQAAAQQAAQQAAAQAAEQQRQQQAAEAARQEAARQEAARQEAARQEAARQEAARLEAERQEKAYQTNLAAVRNRAVDIGRNSIYGSGNLESQRQYNEALSGLREADRNAVAQQMTQARESARVENQKAQEAERDKAIEQIAGKESNTSRIASALSSVGSFLADPLGSMAGGPGTISGTLASGAKWGMRGLQALGPAGGIIGALGGMIANNVDQNQMLENLRGYNPNGLGGVVAAGDLAQLSQNFNSPLWNRNGGRGQDREGKTVNNANPNSAGPTQARPVDKQAMGALNSLIPTSARTAMEAGQIASNQYLRALHGRYAKYMLATGAEGSGTSLLQRTAGGQGALGGTSGRLLYSTGGNS